MLRFKKKVPFLTFVQCNLSFLPRQRSCRHETFPGLPFSPAPDVSLSSVLVNTACPALSGASLTLCCPYFLYCFLATLFASPGWGYVTGIIVILSPVFLTDSKHQMLAVSEGIIKYFVYTLRDCSFL